MKRTFIYLFLLFVINALPCVAQNDVIMLRDGREKHVKITQVGKSQTFYKLKDDKRSPEESIDNALIYMLKYEKRGNAYFGDDGRLMSATSAPIEIPADACVIYTVDHREIPAYNIMLKEHMVTFFGENPNKKRKKSEQFIRSLSLAKVDVFFILYPDGTRDVINEFDAPQQQQAAAQQTATVQQQTSQTEYSYSYEEEEDDDEVTVGQNGREYPCRATIITKKKVKLQVYIYEETPTTVSYRKEKSVKASIFKLARKNIASIKYQ